MICVILCAVVALLIIAAIIIVFHPPGWIGVLIAIFVLGIAAYIFYEFIKRTTDDPLERMIT